MNYIITGTSRGIGKELLELVLDEGHSAISVSRSKTQLNTEKTNTGRWTEIRGDLNDASVLNRISLALEKWDKLDVLINNAGILVNKPFEELNTDDFNLSYKVNVLAPVLLIKNCLPWLRKNPPSHVINIGSVGGIQGSVKFPGLSFYSSAKGALAVLTECLAEEYKDSGITFNCLALGSAQTEMLEQAFPGYKAPVSAGQMAEYIYNYSRHGAAIMNGKIIPVALTTP